MMTDLLRELFDLLDKNRQGAFCRAKPLALGVTETSLTDKDCLCQIIIGTVLNLRGKIPTKKILNKWISIENFKVKLNF